MSIVFVSGSETFGADASSNPKYIGITERKLESGFGYAIGCLLYTSRCV